MIRETEVLGLEKTSGPILVSESTLPSHKPALLGLVAGSGAGARRIQDGPRVSSTAREQGWVRKWAGACHRDMRANQKRSHWSKLGHFEPQTK